MNDDELLIRFEKHFYMAIQEIENTRTKNRLNIIKIFVILWIITLMVWWFK